MKDGQELLAEYLRTGSEAAFREVVHRYLNFVYSVALRLVGGDTLLAGDVAQTVFINLARNAEDFSSAGAAHVITAPWSNGSLKH